MKTIATNHLLRRVAIPLFFILSIFLTNLALLRADFFRPHDYTHAARLLEMHRSLQAGEFPVRWSENFGFGYGMPLFLFYAPLPYYFGQLPLFLDLDAIVTIKLLYVLSSVLCWIGSYFFSKALWGRGAGVIAASLCTLSTYRALNLYARGAIGETFAQAILPFTFYGIIKLRKDIRIGVLSIALSYAGVLLSHNLTGLFALPFLLLFWLSTVDISRQNLKILVSKVTAFIGAILFAIALSSFYVLPAFVEKNNTRVEQTITTGGYFDFRNHFLGIRQLIYGTWGYGGSVPGLQDGLSFAVGLPVLFLSAVSIPLLFFAKERTTRRYGVMIIFLAACSLFLTTERSRILWEYVSLGKYIQFPWRLLGIAHIFLAVLAGSIWPKIFNPFLRGVLLVLVVLFLFSNSNLFRPERYEHELSQWYSTDPAFIRTTLSKTLNDYLPPSVVGEAYPEPTSIRFRPSDTAITSTELIKNTPTAFSFFSRCDVSCGYDILVFRYPGWSATIDGKNATLMEKGDQYFLSVPAGDRRIDVYLQPTALQQISLFISLSAVVIFLILLCINQRTSKSGKHLSMTQRKSIL